MTREKVLVMWGCAWLAFLWGAYVLAKWQRRRASERRSQPAKGGK